MLTQGSGPTLGRGGGSGKKFQIGVYVIYVKSENILDVGATRDFKDRVVRHKGDFLSNSGHANKYLQTCYTKIKKTSDLIPAGEKNLSHYQILDNYFKFIPLFCYEINCSETNIKAHSNIDFIVSTLEPRPAGELKKRFYKAQTAQIYIGRLAMFFSDPPPPFS